MVEGADEHVGDVRGAGLYTGIEIVKDKISREPDRGAAERIVNELRRRNILIGTASWTDPTLVKDGHFYPPGTKSPEERLRFYASQFPIVEVDSTYYFPPSEKNAVLWIDRTPKDFTFNIKAYSLLTNHPTKRESLYKDLLEDLPDDVAGKRNLYRENLPEETVEEVWQRFHDALMPLHSAGKLGAVLFQFPQWFVIGRKNKDYILECAERLKDFRIGGAVVSEKHANFIVNDQKGTAADVRRVGDHVRGVVAESSGVELVYEVEFVGDWDGWPWPA